MTCGLQGERQMKLQAKQLREEAEEQKRVKIDIEEAKFQAEQRKHAIEQAKTKQYYQSDRVKEFHVSSDFFSFVFLTLKIYFGLHYKSLPFNVSGVYYVPV